MCHNERMGFAPYFSPQADFVRLAEKPYELYSVGLLWKTTQGAYVERRHVPRTVTAYLVLLCF